MFYFSGGGQSLCSHHTSKIISDRASLLLKKKQQNRTQLFIASKAGSFASHRCLSGEVQYPPRLNPTAREDSAQPGTRHLAWHTHSRACPVSLPSPPPSFPKRRAAPVPVECLRSKVRGALVMGRLWRGGGGDGLAGGGRLLKTTTNHALRSSAPQLS